MDDDVNASHEMEGRATTPRWTRLEEVPIQSVHWTLDSSNWEAGTEKLPIFDFDPEFLKLLEPGPPSETQPEFAPPVETTEQDYNFESESTSLQAKVTDLGVAPGDCTIPDTPKDDKAPPDWYTNTPDKNANIEDVLGVNPRFGNWLSLKSSHNRPAATHLYAGRSPGGLLKTSLRFRNVTFIDDAQYFIRSVMHRVQRPFTEDPINKVCPNHVKKYGLSDSEARQILQAGEGHGQEYFYTDKGARPSLMLAVDPPNEQGEVVAEKMFHCLCTSKCLSVSHGGKQKESSRDLALVQTLEAKRPNGEMVVLARATHSIWPKADICRRDYVKRERWEAKGGANQKQQEGRKRKKQAKECPVGKKIKVEVEVKVEEDIPVFTAVEVTWHDLTLLLKQKIANGECSLQDVVTAINE